MLELAEKLIKTLTEKNIMVVTAESCTGGLVAAALTDVPGSSAVFERGYVTYANEAKSEMLDVPVAALQEYGAVSEQVAKAMAQGALTRSHARIAVSCTGVAGPGGGSEAKPVGLVYIGIACDGQPVRSYKLNFEGDRAAIRRQTVETALQYILDEAEEM